MDLTQISVLSGLVATLILAVITIARQRECEPKHFFFYLAAYLSGSNIAPSIYLILYVFFPDPETIPTKLKGHEKHISFAGLALLILSLIVLWRLFKDAYIRSAKSEHSGHTSF